METGKIFVLGSLKTKNKFYFRERYNVKQQALFHVLAAYSMYNTEVIKYLAVVPTQSLAAKVCEALKSS